MDKFKHFIVRFCISTTFALIGMLVSILLFQRDTNIRIIDIMGIMVASFLIIGLSYVFYEDKGKSRLENSIKIFIHYVATVLILYIVGRRLQWLRLDLNHHILSFIGIVTLIYGGVWFITTSANYKTSKKINEALGEYQKRRK